MQLCRIMRMIHANTLDAAEEESKSRISREINLLLNLVCAAEHVIHICEVVGAWEQSIRVALGSVVLLQMSLLTKIAHLNSMSATRFKHRIGCHQGLTSS